jgi:hypothetical protein
MHSAQRDIRLDTLPQDVPWSKLGPRKTCRRCGTVGAANVVPNWHDPSFEAMPLAGSKKPSLGRDQ